MLWILLILAGYRTFNSASWIAPLLHISGWFHHQCLELVPTLNAEVHRALICGEPLPKDSAHTLLTQSALIHWISGTGTHLLLLLALIASVVRRWPTLRWVAVAFLGVFCLASGFPAPLVRSLLAQGLRWTSHRWKLAWPPHQRVLLSGLGCLVLNPEWANSPGLQLSWGAAVITSYVNRDRATRLSRKTQQAFIWILMTPLLLPLSAPSPLGILCNLLMAPLMGWVLYPLSFASLIVPWLATIFAQIWSALITALTWLPLVDSHPVPVAPVILWAYILILHLCRQSARLIAVRSMPDVRCA